MYDKEVLRNLFSEKRGQVTIFVIVAVLVVSGIVLYFVLSSDSEDTQDFSGTSEIQSPSAFLSSCMENDVRREIREIGLGGGTYDPDNSIRYKFTNGTYTNEFQNITYLCYTPTNYDPCEALDPTFVSGIEEEMKPKLEDKFESCIGNLKSAYEDNGFEVEGDTYSRQNYYLNLSSDDIELGLSDTSWNLDKVNESTRIEDLSFDVSTNLFDLASVSSDIVASKSQTCNFDISSYTAIYNNYEIDVDRAYNGSEIYTVEHVNSNDVFRFATRGCVPGPLL